MKEYSSKGQSINKLILFVSEACNLRCKYCYVMRPNNNSNKMMMSEETAKNLARRIFSQYESCNFVQFFGGEPTLNISAMRAFVDETLRMVSEGIVSCPPSFGIVTNGASRHSREMVAFCRENKISATVSLDGFKHIHDVLRPRTQGKGTYDAAVKTIEELLTLQIPVAIETVYTSLHIDKGCSIADLFQFTESLGVKKLIFHTAYPPAPQELCPFDDAHFEQLRDYHIDAVNWWFESLLTERNILIDMYFKDLLVPLIQGGGSGVAGGGCPAGARDFAVGPGGDVYSCHLLYRIPQFYLGNILTDDSLEREDGLPRSTDDLQECVECFARHWCQPCGALNLNWGDAWTPPQRECALRKTVLLRIGELAFKHLVIPESTVTNVLRKAVGV